MKKVYPWLQGGGRLLLLAAFLGMVIAGPSVAKSASVGAKASPGDGEQESEAVASEAPGEDAEAQPADAPAADPPSDQEWFVDGPTGRRYKIEKIPKSGDVHVWTDENHIRLPGGVLKLEVVKHDDQWFWVKIWERARPIAQPPKPAPTEAEIRQAAAAFESEAGTVDRIRLTPFDTGLPRAGQWRNGFDVADMNHDGHLDIVFGPSRKGVARPNIFLGDGHGNWRRWSEARYPDLPYDYGDATAADFNGDGNMDVAFGVHLRGMLALIGDGTGGFEPWSTGIAIDVPGHGGDARSFSSRAIEAVDWNRDGRPDLLALGEGPKGVQLTPGKNADRQMINTARGFLLYANHGDGTWTPQAVENGPADFGDGFALGDFDRDGRTDIAVASRIRGNKSILRTSSSATDDGLLAPARIESLRSGALVTSVAAAQLVGGGADELIVAYIGRGLGVWRSGIDVFYADAAGQWTRRVLVAEESRVGITTMSVGELDGDGAPDLVALTGDGEVWVFLGDSHGFFDREDSPELPQPIKGCAGSQVRLVDLDADGRHEVVASFAGEPTGPAGLPTGSMPGCPDRGRITAWKVTAPNAEPPGVAAKTDGPGSSKIGG
jgi:FG-GAP-like repeat